MYYVNASITQLFSLLHHEYLKLVDDIVITYKH
jgi:hypothetical protein